ncbi:serine/threonine protein kinase [Archangium primigenium]|uniref:serine/threonine protein kinase n=1 Tax=[Archangium] primigenium TaxID=2792470 RepID=UPI00195F139E|nr:serine/threonine-protein kinase [Archangium primigenium]MBM7114809.1 protein kinase [Archangium primigenium]
MEQSTRERFGRYEMVSKLGRGGMAETWRARLLGAAGVTKPVLIKKVLTEYANDDSFIAMFISEARISATLSHGNIAQVFDFGRADGEFFLAMEFVDGQPLHRVMKRALKTGLQGIPTALAVFIALEMCRGLHYAHTRRDDKGVPLGIVHRDISPDNVLLSYEGQVKIVDFGIAKARALRNFQTEPGVVKGKYLFFSPEQARGEEVDARTDVWATGVVLYELLCGKLPVSGPAYTAMPKIVDGAFPSPRELNPEVPEELDDIVMRALAVDADERFESCHAFGDALAGFLYTSAPRFSSMSVSYLLQELFREDLEAEGREVHVPKSFLEELSLWRQGRTEPRGLKATPAPRAASPAPDEAHVTTAEQPATEWPRGLVPALGVGAALVGALLLFLHRETPPPASLGALQPLPRTAPAAPPPETAARPEPPKVAPPVQAPPREDPLSPTETLAAAPPPRTAAPKQEPGTHVPKPPVARKRDTPSNTDTASLHARGLRLIQTRDYREAEKTLWQCIQADPYFAPCYMLLGSAVARLGRSAEGASYYRTFLRLAPNSDKAPQVRMLVEQYDKDQASR